MFLALFVKQSGPILVEAIVIQVMDHSMDCVLSNMGITKRVYVNRNDEIESFDYLKHDGSLTLSVKWKEVGSCQMLQMFSTTDYGHPERAFFQKFETFGLGQTNWAKIL